jgi:hypothetical protein
MDKNLQQRMRTGYKMTIKRFVQNLVNIYHDNWWYIIFEELGRQVSKETLDKYQFLLTQELNILKRVVNDLSVIYNKPAKRKAVIEGKEISENGETKDNKQLIDAYEELTKDSNKDEALKYVNRYTNLTNNVMLKPTYRDDKLEYDIYMFNNVEIYTDPEDWKEIIAVKYYHGLNVDPEGSASYFTNSATINNPVYMPFFKLDEGKGYTGGMVQDYYSCVLWVKKDMKNNGIIEDNGNTKNLKGGTIYYITPTEDYEMITEEEDIPYLDSDGEPILPFVLYNRVYPVDNLLNFTEGNDLRDLTVNSAVLMVWLNSVEKYQSFKQIVFNTDDPDSIPTDIKMGPGDAIVNPTKEGGGSVEVLDLQSDIKAKYELIKERIMQVLTGYGISPQNFTMSGSPTSGFALKISNIGKIESRESQLPLYANKEQELFDIERIIWNYHNPTSTIPDEAKLEVDFAELNFPKSPEESIKEDEFNIRHNVITEIDLIRRNNPDFTEEQALEEFQKNKAFNEANQPAPIQLNNVQQPSGFNNANQNNQKVGQENNKEGVTRDRATGNRNE